MTESPEIAAVDDFEMLQIPWFLDCTNPEVIARRAESKARNELARKEALNKRMAKPLNAKPKSKGIAAAHKAKTQPVAPKSKPAAIPAPAKPKAAKYADDAVITVTVDKFPHKVGSQAEAKSALLKTGMTVAEYKKTGTPLGLKGNWHIAHIRYCLSYNYISLEG